jgi:hypothetical protein
VKPKAISQAGLVKQAKLEHQDAHSSACKLVQQGEIHVDQQARASINFLLNSFIWCHWYSSITVMKEFLVLLQIQEGGW